MLRRIKCRNGFLFALNEKFQKGSEVKDSR